MLTTITRIHRLFLAAAISSGLLLSGCTGGTEDLESYVSNLKRKPKRKIPDVPVLKTYPGFSYESEELRNPFIPYKKPKDDTNNDNGVAPDDDRIKEPLEHFSLNALILVGTLQQPDAPWALVSTPGGEVHRVTVGNYIGRNNGRILNIQENLLTIKEIVPDGLGGWREQETDFNMPEVKEPK